MINERRQKPRTKISGIHYIQIGQGNGGVVLDISEDGLSFQAAAPLLSLGAVQFSFLSRQIGRIDAEGEIAWLSADKKACGLRFTHLPPAAWECVHELLGSTQKSKTEEGPAETLVAATAANARPRTLVGSKSDAAVGRQLKPSREYNAAPSNFELPSLLPSLEDLDKEWKAVCKQVFFRGLRWGVTVTVLVASALWAVHVYDGQIQNQIAELLARVKGTISSSWQAQRESSNAQEPGAPAIGALPRRAASGGVDANVLSVPNIRSSGAAGPNGPATSDSTANTDVAPGETPPRSVADLNASASQPSHAPSDIPSGLASAARPSRSTSMGNKASGRENQLQRTDALRSEDDGQEDLEVADKMLRSSDKGSSFATAAQWLWAAVKKGNTQAEIELSDLYLSGEGVTRNCEQARILLRAAASKGNTEAREHLQTLAAGGCRS